jgi:hypothetical protein
MATSPEYAQFVENQFRGLDGFSMRRMFGEYALYLQGRVLGFLADEQILLQNTPTASKLLPDAEMRKLFPGSKLFILFADEGNAHLLKSVSQAMWEELPLPKPRKSRKKVTPEGIQATSERESVHGERTDGPRKGDLHSSDPEICGFLDFHRKVTGR